MLEALKSIGQTDTTILIALFSIAWFLAGYLIGRKSAKQRTTESRDRADKGRLFNNRRGDRGDRGRGDRDRSERGDRGDRGRSDRGRSDIDRIDRVDRNRGERGGDRDRPAPAAGTVEMYVGNLSFGTDEKELCAMFEEFGKVTSARIIKNKFNGKSKGFGFVEMPDRSEAENAIKALSDKEVEGRRIVVNEAKSSARD